MKDMLQPFTVEDIKKMYEEFGSVIHPIKAPMEILQEGLVLKVPGATEDEVKVLINKDRRILKVHVDEIVLVKEDKKEILISKEVNDEFLIHEDINMDNIVKVVEDGLLEIRLYKKEENWKEL